MEFYTYDLETYPNCFLFCGKFEEHGQIYLYEISSRRDDRPHLLTHLSYLENRRPMMIGYNSLNFDYPILHELMLNPYTFNAQAAYLHAQKIFAQEYGRNMHAIQMSKRAIPQVDLSKINHFDNKAKRTTLKALQFAMRSESVEDLPIAVRDLTSQEMDQLRAYNVHDVLETEKFLKRCKPLIALRQDLIDNGTLVGDVLNYADTKIGEQYLVSKIGRGKCFKGSKPNQTKRTEVKYSDVLLNKIYFRTEEFQEVHEWFKKQRIDTRPRVKGKKNPTLEIKLAGLDFVFGVGGVHASVENKRYYANEEYEIVDIDVSGMYVAVAIANRFAPEHLGEDFTLAYKQLQADRKKYPKGTTMNAVLKLAGNGVYGNSNNEYSCFYDPKYTFSVTLNGQLQLAQLAESLSLLPGLELIQANTDGITAYVPRRLRNWFDLWCRSWETETGLTLEEVHYSSMYIRDVNNYIATTTDGKIKRKGAYWWPLSERDYEGVYNKDFSNIASIKAADVVMRKGLTPEQAVLVQNDPFDFMLRYKTTGGSTVYIGDKACLKTVRYYVSTRGEPMTKITPVPPDKEGQFKRKPKVREEVFQEVMKEIGRGVWDERIHTANKKKYETKTDSIEKGWKVKQCNVALEFDWTDVDWKYYEEQTRKLVIGENSKN